MYRLHLDLIGWKFSGTILERLFDSFDQAIAASTKTITAADEEYSNGVVDEECDLLESLLGVAFVAAQTEITAATAHVKSLHERFQRDFPSSNLATTSGRKADILRLGSPIIHPPYTAVEVLNAFANFFKHSDEWDSQWRDGTQQQLQTISILRAVGAVPSSTGTLRTGADAAGVDWNLSVHGLIDIVRNWRQNLCSNYETELENRGLL